jgi:hypothetical protein
MTDTGVAASFSGPHLARRAQVGDVDGRQLYLARLVRGDLQDELASDPAVAQVLLAGLVAAEQRERAEVEGPRQVHGHARLRHRDDADADRITDVRVGPIDARGDGGRVGIDGRGGGAGVDHARVRRDRGPREQQRERRGCQRARDQCRSLRARASKNVVSAGR